METLIHPQFIIDSSGQKTGVILTMEDFDKLLEELEDIEDAKAFDSAMSRENKEFIPFEQAVTEIRNSRLGQV